MPDEAVATIISITDAASTKPIETAVPGLYAIGGDVPAYQLTALYQPMIGFVVQGEKRLSIGKRKIDVEAPSYFVLPMDLPLTATVHPDRDGRPYRSIGLNLDRSILQELLRDVDVRPASSSGVFLACPMDGDIAEALVRLVRLTERPHEIAALAPAYKREIFFRVLVGPQGNTLRQLARSESNLSKIEKAVQWIRRNFDQSMEVGLIARTSGMALTTFHRQFKSATGLSPLQFQKQLRLLEARNLIAYEGLAVSNAAFKVGYESPSQFTREYARFFGTPPSKHGAAIRRFEVARV